MNRAIWLAYAIFVMALILIAAVLLGLLPVCELFWRESQFAFKRSQGCVRMLRLERPRIAEL